MRVVLFRLIGILEISGGLYGAVIMLRRLLAMSSAQDSLFALLGMLMFGFVLGAGIALLEGGEHGVAWSRWAQLLQLPLIATPVFSYALYCGAYLDIYSTLHLARPWVDGHIGSQGLSLALGGPATTRLGINLAALLSWLVLRLR